jgi:adenosine deaminase
MTAEYELAVRTFNLSVADVRRTSLYGFKSMFLPYEEKRAFLIEARKELDRLGFLSEDYH